MFKIVKGIEYVDWGRKIKINDLTVSLEENLAQKEQMTTHFLLL